MLVVHQVDGGVTQTLEAGRSKAWVGLPTCAGLTRSCWIYLHTISLTHTCEENKESRPGGVDFIHYAISREQSCQVLLGFFGGLHLNVAAISNQSKPTNRHVNKKS